MSGYWRAVTRTAWVAMGRWRWVCLVLVLISIAMTPIAGPSHGRWIEVAPVDGQEDGTATLETRATHGSPTISVRLSMPADRWIYRIGAGSWVDAPGTPVQLELETERDGLPPVEVCRSPARVDCWRWMP